MDDINRSISQYVKSGKYYEDARSWYISRFILPMSERTYLMIVVGFYMFVLLISGYYYYNTNPADPEVTYMLPSEDISTTYLVIEQTGDLKEEPQINITKYVLANYVIHRESYTYGVEAKKKQLSFIRNTTVGTEYLKYNEMISDTNPNSPALIYLDKYKKTAKVTKVVLSKTSSETQQAMVYFQSFLRNVASNQVVSQDFVATINFKIDNIEMLMEDKAKKLGFLVTGYSLRDITKKVK